MENILIVDDEKGILDLLTVVFQKQGFKVFTAMNAEKAFTLINEEDIDLVLTDIKLPQKSGMDILTYTVKTKPNLPVVLMTAYGTINQAVKALKAGATDYIVKPFDIEELQIIVKKGLERRSLQAENIRLKKELYKKNEFENIVGKSKKIQDVFDLSKKIADTDSTVLISGESGTGKEMVARAIHYLSRRRDKPFVSLNCGALPENLLESELFGHVKGAFTGAVINKKGMFEVADKGSLMLDEIGEMSPLTQVKVLRALQEKSIRKVGGTQEIPVDVRIISVTNQNLKEMIKDGSFREDLFYRLNVISLKIPPLRERTEDIPLLVNHFLKKYCLKMDRKMKRITPEIMKIFEAYFWPGNIRELENMIERIVAIEERETITRDCLPHELLGMQSDPDKAHEISPGFDLNKTLDEISRQYVKEALDRAKNNLKQTSDILGINYRSLRYLIDKFDLKLRSEKSRQQGTR